LISHTTTCGNTDSLSNAMDGYDDASRTLRWEMGGPTSELLRLLREHAGTLKQLHVA
jgi:hypothetical protein